ncbi:MAG: XTP/dITP diphosphatase [Deltaproteobacteria bacterium]|nr:XTP/dITP diphosphatase [Deltaproteobacteria bacterium]
MELLVATRNRGKLEEIRLLLADSGVLVRSAGDVPGLPEVEEDGTTFEANALKKGQVMADVSGLLTLADDSGLEVEALGGLPGVRSSRYAGEAAADADNIRKLLAALQGVPQKRRRGAFRCVMALCQPGRPGRLFRGCLQGVILEEPRGTGGFGYDPVFLVPEYGKTLAELSMAIKNRISHRGQALRQVLAHFQSLRMATNGGNE